MCVLWGGGGGGGGGRVWWWVRVQVEVVQCRATGFITGTTEQPQAQSDDC